MEVATAEELFDYPLHPYTKSLISAVPIPDPVLEKHKKLISYDPSIHDYSKEQPSLTCIGHDHYVFGNTKETEEYKAIRDAGVPIKSIIIMTDEEKEEEAKNNKNDVTIDEAAILESPLHDTGNFLYSLFSFIPVIGTIGGLIAGKIFKKRNYIRNYKACIKGVIAGIATFGGIIGLYLIALLSAML